MGKFFIEARNYCYAKKVLQNPFEIKCGSHIYEVDEFYGENEGLIVAEIELSSVLKPLKTYLAG
jgi:adenylate cyclase